MHNDVGAPETLREVDPAGFRNALGHFGSGVTVVAASTESGPVGFTCQSFASLSLCPPRILLCPGLSSTSWPAIRAAGAFSVTILAENQRALSNRFAVSRPDKFSGVDWYRSPLGHPLLAGAAAWLDCELSAEYDGGDHTIAVAEVRGLGTTANSRPLLYYRGAYARIAPMADRSPRRGHHDGTTETPADNTPAPHRSPSRG